MTNIKLANHILKLIRKWGVEDICLCPGGRNAPFVKCLEDVQSFRIHSHFDERSAGFYALGKSRARRKPVAVITTSGTAVAEVLPAVIEACYTETPLIIITADRPKNLRGTGAPQVIVQNDLFQNYVETSLDIEIPWDGNLATWSSRKPLHINVCFDEPLIDEDVNISDDCISAAYGVPASPLMMWRQGRLESVSLRDLCDDFQDFISHSKSPLLIVSDFENGDIKGVESFVKAWPGLVYFEGLSGLRSMAHPGKLQGGEHFLRKLLRNKRIDSVVRIGGVPTTRLWRDLEKNTIPCFSLSSRPFPGLSHSRFYWSDNKFLTELLPTLKNFKPTVFGEILNEDRAIKQSWSQLLDRYPLSEPSYMQWLSAQVPLSANLYIGNSSPIRGWDLFAKDEAGHKVLANRGANGIDGQISTSLGYLSDDKDLWVIVGDLTALYDANSLWAWKKNSNQCVKLIIINNNGGQIFKRIFDAPLFNNQHEVSFDHWANQWGLPYFKSCGDKKIPVETSWLLEINPDAEQTSQFWQDYDSIFE